MTEINGCYWVGEQETDFLLTWAEVEQLPELVMQDEAKTVIKVSTPSEKLVEELQATMPELQEVLNTGNKDAVALCYDLAARLISCNRSFITVTAEELREKYRIDLESLVIFYSAYLDFIQEINDVKNWGSRTTHREVVREVTNIRHPLGGSI